MSIALRSTTLTKSLSRNFAYKLTDKKATANFLKAASREAFEIDDKQRCSVLIFSVGAYMKCVFPVLKEWHGMKDEFQSGKLLLKITKIVPSFDETGKNVENIFTFLVNGKKVTVTSFNTTQKIKVEGQGYTELIEMYLRQLFTNKITDAAAEIDDYNKGVIAALSGKRKAVSRPYRSVRMKSQFACTLCESTFVNISQLNSHGN